MSDIQIHLLSLLEAAIITGIMLLIIKKNEK